MKKSFTASLFLVFSYVATIYSQENFRPGFIISQKGDTVSGYIDYRSWDKNPTTIVFRESEVSPETNFTPTSILGFSVNNEYYLSSKVRVEISPDPVNELKIDPELHFVTEDAFLYCMVSGRKALYHYKDAREKDNFYIPADSGITLLIHKLYLKEVKREDLYKTNTGKSLFIKNKYYVKMENKSYIGQLASYLKDCQAVLSLISSVKYSQTDLLKLFQIYQKKCEKEVTINKARKGIINYGVLTGLSLNTLKWGENRTFNFSKTNYGFTPQLIAGAFLELKFRGNAGKWSLNNEFMYAPFRVKGEYENYVSTQNYYIAETEIAAAYFKLNNMLRFGYPLGKWTIFVNGGISNSYGKITKNVVTTYTRTYSEERTETDKAMHGTDRYELGFNAGMGLRYLSWSLEGRWDYGDGMSTLVALKSNTQRVSLILSYRFPSKN